MSITLIEHPERTASFTKEGWKMVKGLPMYKTKPEDFKKLVEMSRGNEYMFYINISGTAIKMKPECKLNPTNEIIVVVVDPVACVELMQERMAQRIRERVSY